MSLTRPTNVPVTVCATATPGTAWPIVDFDPFIACRTIPAGQTATSFTVKVRGDRFREADETFSLHIAAIATSIRTTDATATGTITNDD